MRDMSLFDVKLLLRLIAFAEYCAKITAKQLKPADKSPAAEVRRSAQKLNREGLLELSNKITHIEITEAGKAARQAETIPLPKEEKAVLAACHKGPISGNKKEVKALGPDANDRLRRMASQGLLKLTEAIDQVWLSPSGSRFLLSELGSEHIGKSQIPAALLGNYANFIRDFFTSSSGQPAKSLTSPPAANAAEPSFDLDQLLKIIQNLRYAQGEDELVPLFKIREEVAHRASREVIDKMLYSLEQGEYIELVTAQEMGQYTDAEINAGIPQEIGGPIFYARIARSS